MLNDITSGTIGGFDGMKLLQINAQTTVHAAREVVHRPKRHVLLASQASRDERRIAAYPGCNSLLAYSGFEENFLKLSKNMVFQTEPRLGQIGLRDY